MIRHQPAISHFHRLLAVCGVLVLPTATAQAEFRAGAAVIDVTPAKLPVLVNGGMLSRSLDKVKTRVQARALVLADDKSKLAIVVVDSCMMSRPFLDEVKSLAAKLTDIRPDRMLISATHTHSAPASMGCLGTDADPDYVPFLTGKIAEAVAAADAKLQAARVGFATIDAGELTALRQWIRQPGKLELDPFGNPTVRANMHAGANWDVVTGEAGPEDPDLTLISVQTRDGRPLAALANFSMHYFSDNDISADYFGLFCEGMKSRLNAGEEFVGLMSHGCSGDIWRRDYTRPESWDPKLTIEAYTDRLLDKAMQAYEKIEYRSDIDLVMAETRMTLNYRVPNKQMLEWAQRVMNELGDKPVATTEQVYAREQIILHERQLTEIVMQAVRIGDIGIATTPNETYALTGLKIKAASPLKQTMVIELANGGDGYIPPAEQHPLGGYNTWAARSAGLEILAEPKIAEACISLLENVSDQARRDTTLSRGPAAAQIAALKPAAWWRLDEMVGPHSVDASGHQHDAMFEPGITFFLEGPLSNRFCLDGQKNRAAMFAGGRARARFPSFSTNYSISCWFWNGMPNDARPVTGWMWSRGADHGLTRNSEQLGIGGQGAHRGRLIFLKGDNPAGIVAGKTDVGRWEWHHLALIRTGHSVKVCLDGMPEVEAQARPCDFETFFFGGRSDNVANWEGRLDEIAVFDRALTADEIQLLSAQGN